ncbi:MAG: Spy/CpxP family protein refolding chaperone [Methylococcaceae bacterium]
MKHVTKIALLTLTISGLLVGRNVLAEPANTATDVNQKTVTEEPKKCDREAGKEKHLATLKTDLKLDANQEAAWAEWVSKIKGDTKNEEKHRENIESWANLPAPERMEKMLEFSKAHIAQQEVSLAATKTFYATLSPEQRLTFDKGFNFEHRSRLGKHWPK